MARSIAIKCPNCGASSFEDANGGERSCRYCRTTFRVSVDAPPVILKRAAYPVPPNSPVQKGPRPYTVFRWIWFAFVVIVMILIFSKFFSK